MQKNKLMLALLMVGGASLLGTAEAQVAGSSIVGVSPTELTQVALGWSVKRSILDKPIYDATKDVLKAMPPFDYSNDTANRYRFVEKDTKIAEQKVADMKRSAASRWKELESDVSLATARLRQAL